MLYRRCRLSLLPLNGGDRIQGVAFMSAISEFASYCEGPFGSVFRPNQITLTIKGMGEVAKNIHFARSIPERVLYSHCLLQCLLTIVEIALVEQNRSNISESASFAKVIASNDEEFSGFARSCICFR